MLSLFPSSLGWTHYIILMKVNNDGARAFYEIEAAREGWTTRDLERQIGSRFYERLAKSRDKEGVLALAREGQQVTTPASLLKDPLVLEFLTPMPTAAAAPVQSATGIVPTAQAIIRRFFQTTSCQLLLE